MYLYGVLIIGTSYKEKTCLFFKTYSAILCLPFIFVEKGLVIFNVYCDFFIITSSKFFFLLVKKFQSKSHMVPFKNKHSLVHIFKIDVFYAVSFEHELRKALSM